MNPGWLVIFFTLAIMVFLVWCLTKLHQPEKLTPTSPTQEQIATLFLENRIDAKEARRLTNLSKPKNFLGVDWMGVICLLAFLYCILWIFSAGIRLNGHQIVRGEIAGSIFLLGVWKSFQEYRKNKK